MSEVITDTTNSAVTSSPSGEATLNSNIALGTGAPVPEVEVVETNEKIYMSDVRRPKLRQAIYGMTREVFEQHMSLILPNTFNWKADEITNVQIADTGDENAVRVACLNRATAKVEARLRDKLQREQQATSKLVLPN